MIRKIIYIMHIIVVWYTQAACIPHASVIGESVWKQLDRVLSISYADKIIYQSDVPFVITEPGSYGVGENLTNVGTTTVISIASGVRDVFIDLHGYDIISDGTPATAIAVSDTNPGVMIRNGSIVGFNIGIYRGYWIKDMTISQCTTGILGGRFVDTSDGFDCGTFYSVSAADTVLAARILQCKVFNSTNYGALIGPGVSTAVVDRCTFQGGGAGVHVVDTTTRGCMILDSLFNDIAGIAISSPGMYTVVRNCSIARCTSGIVITGVSPIITDSTILHCSDVGIDIQISNAGTARSGTVCSNVINDANIGIRVITAFPIAIYNNYMSDTAITFSGISPVKATPSQIATTANFWTNITD